MEYDKIKQLMEDMGNSKLSSIDIDFPDGTKISMKKELLAPNVVITSNDDKEENVQTKQTKEDESENEILSHMIEVFNSKYSETLRKKQKEDKKSLYDVIKLASIVEKEAVLDEDRPIIAYVFYNRIDIGMPLQSDATIQYIFKERKKSITYDDLKIKSPYNSYINKGLPPTPIANPGIKSIEAVLYPANTEYLYFVATIDGGNNYSKTYEEHVKNVEQYRKDREDRNNSYSTDN